MKGKGFLHLLVAVLVIAAIAFVAIFGIGEKKSGSASDVKLGLDLAGGVSITYQTVKEDPTSDELSDTVYKMQKRAEGFSTEAEVYPEGENRITVAIPDVTDADSVLEKLGSAGNIYFIYGKGPDGLENIAYTADGGAVLTRSMDEIIANGDVVVDGKDIADAQPKMYQDQYNGVQYVVALTFNATGASKFAEGTRYAYNYVSAGSLENIIAIVYDNEVVSAPRVSSVIEAGEAQIQGQKDMEESRILATTIRVGALPLELSVLRYYVEGAQLGANALDTSLVAGAIGILLIILFMVGRFDNIPKVLPQVIGVSISIMIIYVLVHVFGWLIDLKTAHVMTEDLKRFQTRAAERTE